MKKLVAAMILFAATNSFGAFGRFPLDSNDTQITVGDWQCLYSGIVERCMAVDKSVVSPTISFSANIYTGMYVSGVVTGTMISGGVTSQYFTTNYEFGDVAVTLTNWSGTYSNTPYAWSGPMSAAQLSAWDAKIIALIPSYLNLDGMGSNYFTTAIGAITNTRVVLSDPCNSNASTTNRYVVPRYRDFNGGWFGNYSDATAPLMLTVSSLWSRLNIGTDFYYSTGTNANQQFHSYKFTTQPTQNVEYVLASFICLATNTFYTTNISAGVTSLVANVNLIFGRYYPFWSSTLPQPWQRPWPVNYGPLPIYHSVYGSDLGVMAYADRTNSLPFIRVLSANTNLAAPDLHDLKLYLKGSYSLKITNAAPTHAGTNTILNGVTNGQRLDFPYYTIDSYSQGAGTQSTSDWSRVETNGQWDSMIGTVIEIVWTNRLAYYGDIYLGYGSVAANWISKTAVNERYMVITSLVATFKLSNWKATNTESSIIDAYDACWDLSDYGDWWFTVPLSYFASVPTPSVVHSTNSWIQFSPRRGGHITCYAGGAGLFGECTTEIDYMWYAWRDMTKMISECLTGEPFVRLETVPTNLIPPALARKVTYGKAAGYTEFADPMPDDEFLMYGIVQDDPGRKTAVLQVLDYSVTNWVYTSEAITLNGWDYLDQTYWNWATHYNICPEANVFSLDPTWEGFSVYSGDRDQPPTLANQGEKFGPCLIEKTASIWPADRDQNCVWSWWGSFGVSANVTWSLFSFLYWDFDYK